MCDDLSINKYFELKLRYNSINIFLVDDGDFGSSESAAKKSGKHFWTTFIFVSIKIAFFYSILFNLLCISTSERVLRTPFAGKNQFFDAKTTFYVFFSQNNAKNNKKACFCAAFLSFFRKWHKNTKKLVKTQKQMILTSQRRVKHPFTGLNTQHQFLKNFSLK